MDEYYSVIQFLPEPLRTELKAMPPERAACVQEIRLRAGQAVQFTVGGAWQPAQQLLPAAQTALAIGASFEGAKAIKKLAPTLVAACCKLMVLTTIFIPIAVKLGFRDQQLIALLIMLGSPTTPSSYVMAKNRGHEGVLTASCVAATTLFSALSLTFWIFVLRSGGYIA